MTQAVAEQLATEKRLRTAAEQRAADVVFYRNEAIFAAKASDARLEVAMVCYVIPLCRTIIQMLNDDIDSFVPELALQGRLAPTCGVKIDA